MEFTQDELFEISRLAQVHLRLVEKKITELEEYRGTNTTGEEILTEVENNYKIWKSIANKATK